MLLPRVLPLLWLAPSHSLLFPTHMLSQICLDSLDASPIQTLLAQPTSQLSYFFLQ